MPVIVACPSCGGQLRVAGLMTLGCGVFVGCIWYSAMSQPPNTRFIRAAPPARMIRPGPPDNQPMRKP
jgi:hypothetical protein